MKVMLISPMFSVVFLLSLINSSQANAQNCTQIAIQAANALASEYCETVKDAYAEQVVIAPPCSPYSSSPCAVREALALCSRSHSLICKNHMASKVGQDSFCTNLYWQDMEFTFRDEFTGDETFTSTKSFYNELQLEGCRLH